MLTANEGYIFLHVPKTAGFSFWHAFWNLFGPQNVTEHLPDFHIQAGDAERLGRCRMISGHVSHRDAAHWFGERRMLTVLREPVDRVLSQYFFLRTLGDPDDPTVKLAQEHDLESYFNLPERMLCQTVWNRMTRQLGAHSLEADAGLDAALRQARETLRQCSWVAIYERLPVHLAELRLEPDFRELALPRERVTPERVGVRGISDRLRARILELNEYDVALYNWAAAEFQADLAA